MTRPIYSRQQDKDHEEIVAALACARWGCESQACPDLYVYDRCVTRQGNAVAWWEIKWRDESYPDYRISTQKWVNMCVVSEYTGLPGLLLVSWPVDGQRVVIFRRVERLEPPAIIVAGRTDRGDPNDREPHMQLELSSFSVLGKTP